MKQSKTNSTLNKIKASEIGLYISLKILLPLCVSVAIPVLLTTGIVQTSFFENFVENFLSFITNGNLDNSAPAKVKPLEEISVSNFQANLEKIVDISLSSDNQRIVAVAEDSTIKIWNLQGQALGSFQANLGKVADISFSPDSRRIVAVAEDSTIKIWNLQGQTLGSFQANLGKVADISFSPDSRRIVAVENKDTIKVWNVERALCISSDKGKKDC